MHLDSASHDHEMLTQLVGIRSTEYTEHNLDLN